MPGMDQHTRKLTPTLPTLTHARKDNTHTHPHITLKGQITCSIAINYAQVETVASHSHRQLKAYGRVDAGPEDGVEDGRHDAAVGTVDELDLSHFSDPLRRFLLTLSVSDLVTPSGCSCWKLDLELNF